VFATLFVLSAFPLGTHPVERFIETHPASSRIRSADGQVLVHASGFLTGRAARNPERSARDFLATHGAAFGLAAQQELVLRQTTDVGHAGAVRFERRVAGLPVFGGDVVLGVDEDARVFLVNTREVAPTLSGRHTLASDVAVGFALGSFPPGAEVEPAAVAAGWRSSGGLLRAVYRVDVVGTQPAGSWRVFVDAETGRPSFREKLRYSATTAQGSVFAVSPAETPDSLCPIIGAAHTLCARPSTATLLNLATGADLSGTQTSVFNCKGQDFPTTTFPAPCTAVAAQADGSFLFDADASFVSPTDDFAAAMAYFHLDKHVTFFKSLDPALPQGEGRALSGALPALVNAHSGGEPLENAFYDSILDAMVFGQGATADFSYDATVMYHEFTHGVVSAWGGFNLDIDRLGAVFEPASLNEGTADSMAVSETGRSALAAFLAAEGNPPRLSFRDMEDSDALRTCQGNGFFVVQFGTSTINGLSGEEHFDGEIWNGFYWEVFDGLRRAGWRGCAGACDAAPAIQYKALQLSAGTAPTFDAYRRTFSAAASALFPNRPELPAYLQCVVERRQLDKCDRTVSVQADEQKVQLVALRYSAFQAVIPATGATQFLLCSKSGAPAFAYARKDAPVELGPVDADGNATVTRDLTFDVKQCAAGLPSFGLPTAGNWHVLVELPGAFTGTGPGADLYLIVASRDNVTRRPFGSLPPTCTPPNAVLIGTPSSSVPPRGQLALTASGGSGSGFSWSLATNNSGGSIDPSTGSYTAGPTGSVTDTVKATDSRGSAATRDVAVTAGVSISPASAQAGTGAAVQFVASGGSGAGFTWSLSTNASGASIGATTGAYRAGGTGGVTDRVRVADSLGNVADATVAVTASGGGCSTSSGVDGLMMAILATAAFLRRAPRSRGMPGR
jgi:hypothetical protein